MDATISQFLAAFRNLKLSGFDGGAATSEGCRTPGTSTLSFGEAYRFDRTFASASICVSAAASSSVSSSRDSAMLRAG
jgi:hypothetical protein